jgi:hypothetical protein
VPDRAPGRLGYDGPGGAQIEAPEPRQPLRAEPAAGLLVGNDDQPDVRPGLRGRPRGVDDGRQAALHVGGAASDQSPVLHPRIELRAAEAGHDVVVAVEVQKRPAIADLGEDGVPARVAVAGVDHLVADRQRVHLRADALNALVVRGARRILGRNGDEVARKGNDRALTELGRVWGHAPTVARACRRGRRVSRITKRTGR